MSNPADQEPDSGVTQPPDTVSLLAYWREHREQMRQSENQWATMTNYILVVTAVLAGFIAQQDFATGAWPLAVLIIAAGGYGVLAAGKYYERATYYRGQARALTAHLVEAGVFPDTRDALAAARVEHAKQQPVLIHLGLYRLWIGLQLGISLVGLVLLVLVLR
jgi:hypothetical protein